MKKNSEQNQNINLNNIKLDLEAKANQFSDISTHVEEKFSIVGVGASAGGLEALEQFFGTVSGSCSMAFIIIMHLDPTHKDIMPELLQRITNMEVIIASDNLMVKPNRVYIIPPNKSMSILKGTLHLFEPLEIRGLRLPIDFFFHSLAEDQRESSIGIILSGMGSDGTLGLRAIKERGGIAAVQDPNTAKFDSMPKSAINDVQVDIVGNANELSILLNTFLEKIPLVKSTKDLEINDKNALDKIINLIRTNVGHNFYLYKENTMYRRIQRRMVVHKIDDINIYVQYLQENIKEIEVLYKEMLIGVTSFFRDSIIWEQLEKNIIPSLLIDLEFGHILRAWIPACSTGEEAYSLAIVFKEVVEVVCPRMNITLQIFATDLDADAINRARKGIFQRNIVADVSQERLDRFFEKVGNNYRINNEIREMVVFAQQNVIMDPPFTKLDMLSCRNLLIYMENELQNKLMSLFHYSINPGGFLILGSAETINNSNDKFKQVEAKSKIYQRSVSGEKDLLISFQTSYSRSKYNYDVKTKPIEIVDDIKTLAEHMILQQFSPASVLVNKNGDIIYINGRTGRYLEPPTGKINWNIFVMLREGLRNEFPSAFHIALKQIEPVVVHSIIEGNKGETNAVNITIKLIETPAALRGMVMVVFTEVSKSVKIKASSKKNGDKLVNVQYMEQEVELKRAREEMQIIIEEMQTSQEELKSANEELQSTNEELQSTNEELTTSKEEMQSLNEELQTVNVELVSRVDDYLLMNSDMKNLLNSTDIATLFLDKSLNIRRFTKQVANLFKILEGDIGRPITDLTTELIYPGIFDDAMEVLDTLESIERNIPTRGRSWFAMRIMPYRTFDDRIDGLVITFNDITKLMAAEEGYMNTQLLLESSIESFKDMMILSVDTNNNYLYFNNAYKEYMKIEYGKEIKIGMTFNDDTKSSEDDLQRFKFDFKRALCGESHSKNWYYGKEEPRYYQTLYKPIFNRNGEIIGATAFAINIALRQYEEESYKLTEALLKNAIGSSKEEIAISNSLSKDDVL